MILFDSTLYHVYFIITLYLKEEGEEEKTIKRDIQQ